VAAKLLLFGFVALLVWGYRRVRLGPRLGGGGRRRPDGRGRAAGGPGSRGRGAAPAVARSPEEVLGVPEGASREEVRRAYHAKVREYHPDRVAGAAPEIQRLAEKRTAELNAAYLALTRDGVGGGG